MIKTIAGEGDPDPCMISLSNSEITQAKKSFFEQQKTDSMNTSLNLLSYFFKKEKSEMSAIKRKRHNTDSQDDPTMSAKKKKALNSNAEELDASQVSDSPSQVLFELDISNSMNIPGDKNPIKVERNQDDAAYISCNTARENQLDIKDPNLSIRSVLNASYYSASGDTSVIKMEKNEERSAQNCNSAVEETHLNSRNKDADALNSHYNDAEAINFQNNDAEPLNSRNNDQETEKKLDIVNVSVNDAGVLNETVEEASSKKKKKKKKKHLDENELENGVIADDVEEMQPEQTVIEDVESSQKKKKKKKKKHRDEESQAEEYDPQTNEENVDASPKKRKKKKGNDVSQIELEAEETVDISPKKRKKNKEKENESENVAAETVKKLKNNDKNFTELELETEGELSFADIRRMFEDIYAKVSVLKSYKAKQFWSNYEFPPFSTDQCKKAFEKVMTKVQKKRTIIELVSAAEKMLTNNPVVFLGENKNVRPITPLKIFSNENYHKISQKYPDHRPIKRLNKIARKWCKLSDQKKLKYLDLALAERPKYLATLEICRKVEPLLASKATLNKSEWLIKDRLAGLPDPPPRNGFGYFLQSGNELYPNVPYTQKLKLMAADYKKIPDEVKEKYNQQYLEADKKYKEALEKYLSSLTPVEQDDRNHHTVHKEEKFIKKRISASNARKKPPASGYALFFRELREEKPGDYSGILKQMHISEKWKALKEEERVEYNRRRLVMYSEWLHNVKEKVNQFFDATKNGYMISWQHLIKYVDSFIQNEENKNENLQTEQTSSNDA